LKLCAKLDIPENASIEKGSVSMCVNAQKSKETGELVIDTEIGSSILISEKMAEKLFNNIQFSLSDVNAKSSDTSIKEGNDNKNYLKWLLIKCK
jgi:hypothetical protein